ncbi:MAG: flagellar basal body P-ring formation protein FlgA, partial [Deltaproteobacteria bacterium]|nr:flagellar basal body P-ring formation protein FlgA [Deltaproteobacteria bacterium]
STISKTLIIYKTNAYISGDKDILVRMPEKLTVQRTAQIVGARRLEEIYMSYVRDNSIWPEHEIGFEGINTPETVALPEGRLTWDVQEKDKQDLVGNVTLIIGFSVDGKPAKKVFVSGKVNVKMEIVRASGKIERGRIITDQDIEQVNEASLHHRKESLISREDVVGKRALRTIQAGQTILEGMFENPPPVKKGDRVVISAENSELKITTAGEALQDGKMGEQVEVLNIQSGRKVLATVKGSGIVEVFF